MERARIEAEKRMRAVADEKEEKDAEVKAERRAFEAFEEKKDAEKKVTSRPSPPNAPGNHSPSTWQPT